jgi:hypothetical protein
VKTRSFQELVKALIEHFNREKTMYAITGAVAASYYGIPRTTLDADFVVYIPPREANRFFQGMKEADVKTDMQKIRRQLRSGYNVITVADRLSPYAADPERRKGIGKGIVQGVKTYFQAPEPLILAKLRMIKATIPRERSQKDKDDIRAILANTRVNKRKIISQARKDGTIEIFTEILQSMKTRKSRQ